MFRFTPVLYSDPTNLDPTNLDPTNLDPTNLVTCKPTTKHLISHWPSFIGALNLTRSSLNTTRRVYFYVIVKMWFKLPIYFVFWAILCEINMRSNRFPIQCRACHTRRRHRRDYR